MLAITNVKRPTEDFCIEYATARPSRRAHVGYAVARLRRRRVGQLSLFDKRPRKRATLIAVPYWGKAICKPKRRRKPTNCASPQ